MPSESIPRRTLTVEAEHDGLRLDHFLTALLPELSRAQVQRLIKEGRVLAAGGRIGGYGSGRNAIDLKRALLAREGVHPR